MCYLIAKDFNKIGSYALQTKHGQQLVDLKKKLFLKSVIIIYNL